MTSHDSTKKQFCSKDQNKAEFKNLDNFDVLSSDFEALKTPAASWPHRPPQPHWPLQPLQPYLLKEFPGFDDLIISATKMTNTGPFLWY